MAAFTKISPFPPVPVLVVCTVTLLEARAVVKSVTKRKEFVPLVLLEVV